MEKQILHVDDELATLKLVKEVLEKAGYSVTSVSSGLSALNEVKNKKFDLILLDIMMPDLSGWEVYERIRKQDSKIKLAFLSVVEISPTRKEELIKKGVSDYMTKPFKPEELKKRVSEILK
jgi:CheY-like chemotaxis protein